MSPPKSIRWSPDAALDELAVDLERIQRAPEQPVQLCRDQHVTGLKNGKQLCTFWPLADQLGAADPALNVDMGNRQAVHHRTRGLCELEKNNAFSTGGWRRQYKY